MSELVDKVKSWYYTSEELFTKKTLKNLWVSTKAEAKVKILTQMLKGKGSIDNIVESAKTSIWNGQYIYDSIQNAKGTKEAIKYALGDNTTKDWTIKKDFITVVWRLYYRFGKGVDKTVLWSVLDSEGFDKDAKEEILSAF